MNVFALGIAFIRRRNSKLSLCRLEESGKGRFARRSAFHSTMRRNSKGHIVVSTSKNTGRAVVIVAPGHQPAMNFPHQVVRNWAIYRDLS